MATINAQLGGPEEGSKILIGFRVDCSIKLLRRLSVSFFPTTNTLSPMAGHFHHHLSFINVFIRENSSETGAPNASRTVQEIEVFNVLQIVAFLLHGAILFTALLSSNVRRTPTWFGLIASWMVFTLSNFLIVGQQIGPDPGFWICLTQAGLIYAAPVLCGFCGVAFILQLYFTVSNIFKAAQICTKRVCFLLLAPPILYALIFAEVLVQGLLNPKLVQRDETGMYCHLTSKMAPIITGFTAPVPAHPQ